MRETYIFNSFLYQGLKGADEYKHHVSGCYRHLRCVSRVILGYKRVKGWTNDVNIFEKKFVLIPINDEYVNLPCCPVNRTTFFAGHTGISSS